jgi:predicted kinase
VNKIVPVLYVMVGLPASGKTTRAKELEEERRTLRLTPEEWMIPLFDDNDANGKRNVLEGRFIWLALRALRRGLDVVLDFGVWAKDERTALRALAAEVGASCELVYLEIDEDEQRKRRDGRAANESESTFYITDEDLADYRRRFIPLDDSELSGLELDPPPTGFSSWSAWASEWWPTSIQ